MNFKKRHYRSLENEVEDLPFLLNAKYILSEKEFHYKIPNYSYSDYYFRFLDRKLIAYYEKHCGETWFKERYLLDIKPAPKHLSLGSHCCLIKNIESTVPITQIYSDLEKINGVKDICISQNYSSKNYSKDIFVSTSENFNLESIPSNYSKEGCLEIIKMQFNTDSIVENHSLSINQLKILVEFFSLLINSSSDQVIEDYLGQSSKYNTMSVEFLTELLREKFYFCTTCFKQYDNKYSMIYYCLNHKPKKTYCRCLDIFNSKQSFLSFKNTNLGKYELQAHFLKTPESKCKCKHCSKVFSTVSFIFTHILSKHLNQLDGPAEKLISISSFFDKLDYLVLDHVFGTSEDIIPPYSEVVRDNGYVKYDMPNVFSGNIIL